MWVIALEALVALALLLVIVWLTMAPSKRRDDEVAERERQGGPGDDQPKG